MEDIKNIINQTINDQEILVINLKIKINYIIDNKIINDQLLEGILEQLLNLFQTDEVFKLFTKLCKYYYKYNQDLINDYIAIYNDMYLDDNDKIMIK